jgi:hypothetical protein
VEAALVRRGPGNIEYVSTFLDVPEDQAEAALRLAVDIGLLEEQSGDFRVASPLCEFVATPSEVQKAAVVRVLLESYEPFVAFRERLTVTTAQTRPTKQRHSSTSMHIARRSRTRLSAWGPTVERLLPRAGAITDLRAVAPTTL